MLQPLYYMCYARYTDPLSRSGREWEEPVCPFQITDGMSNMHLSCSCLHLTRF